MAIVIKGLSGPYQNKQFKIESGMSLGRRQGDILLEADNTISSLHGRVIMRPTGVLCLKDAGSQNQFLVNGKKVAAVDLVEGTIFQVGQCLFQVYQMDEKEAKALTLEKNWKDLIFDALAGNKSSTVSEAKSLSPSVTVSCVQGPCADISWFLGFGPRLFGPLCEDIEILENDSGDVAFEISQGSLGPMVRGLSPNVLINKKNMTEKPLEDGDEIQVGSSLFKIRLG